MSAVLDILFIAAAAIASLFLRCQIAKHRLRVGRISVLELALYDVCYSGTLYKGEYRFTFTSSRISLRLHWPCRPNPKLVTFIARDILYKSTTADVSAGSLSAVLWFFPVLLHQTAGPWADAELADFRIRIFSSNATPYFVKQLRENLVSTMLKGDILRLDDFGTSARFSGATETIIQSEEDPHEDGENKCPGTNHEHSRASMESLANDDGKFTSVGSHAKWMQRTLFLYKEQEQDEVRISSYARGFMTNNKEGRMYTFKAIDAQLRRSWTENRGSFVMIAKESRWMRVPCLSQMAASLSFWQ